MTSASCDSVEVTWRSSGRFSLWSSMSKGYAGSLSAGPFETAAQTHGVVVSVIQASIVVTANGSDCGTD